MSTWVGMLMLLLAALQLLLPLRHQLKETRPYQQMRIVVTETICEKMSRKPPSSLKRNQQRSAGDSRDPEKKGGTEVPSATRHAHYHPRACDYRVWGPPGPQEDSQWDWQTSADERAEEENELAMGEGLLPGH